MGNINKNKNFVSYKDSTSLSLSLCVQHIHTHNRSSNFDKINQNFFLSLFFLRFFIFLFVRRRQLFFIFLYSCVSLFFSLAVHLILSFSWHCNVLCRKIWRLFQTTT